MHVASQKVRLAQYHVVGLLAPNIYFKHVMTQVQIRELEHVRNLGIEFEPTGITKYQVLQLDVQYPYSYNYTNKHAQCRIS